MRLFIAIDLGQAVRALVEKETERLRALAPNAKWVKAEGIHVTLAFLGHLADARAEEVKAIVSEVARRHPPLQLKVEGIGAFGSSARPRVLWAGLTGDVEPLASIKTDLEKRLTPFGYQPETRAFKPHLTLARARLPRGDSALARCIPASEIVSFGTAKVSRLILFRSDLSPKGAKYTALCEPGLTG
ncbi:MAG TPA: RNA 2',3'-cyclic phosphodiesterase [Myxococcaceae bacterium]|nr:RNA 2',3'-cyclic phosphodiesterase [Myxococcaceae bacterium]